MSRGMEILRKGYPRGLGFLASAVFAASLLSAQAVQARSQRTAAQRVVRENERCRVVIKTQQMVLPADAYEGKRIEVQEGARAFVRRTFSDAQPVDGKFTRTIRTATVVLKGNGPAPWARRPDDYHPRWKQCDVPYLYTSKRLGPVYLEDQSEPAGGAVLVRLFAPKARDAYLVIHETGERIRLAPDRAGVWETKLARAPRELYGKTYHYEVDGKSISDPYCQLTAGDYGPSCFARLPALPLSFGSEPVLKKLQRQGLCEVHVKDMTAHSSAPLDEPGQRGTYRGLAARGVLSHYEDLGVGGIEALPVSQFDVHSGDPQNGKPTLNHWGYMTTHYGAIHRGWASRPQEAHLEFQNAVQALRQTGKSVILDVAFNHTANGSDLHLRVLGRDYYYRLNPDGSDADGAGCKNELATERPMVRKMIVQTLRDFVTKYGVDGFRLDLGALIDKQTIREIDRALPKHVFLTAEPWAADPRRARWSKGDLQDTRLTVWNDSYRNAAWSFLEGKGNDGTRNRLMNAVCGSVCAYGQGFASRPTQSVNYIESHDELTLADRVGGNKQRAFLGQVLLLTSQGIPMLGHGQEFMRSKGGIANAHNLDNEVSWINWDLKRQHQDFYRATKGLLALRAASPHFQYDRPLSVEDITWLTPGNANALGYLVRPPAGSAGRSNQPDYLVLLNSDPKEHVTFQLPRAGDWRVVVDGASLQVNPQGLRTAAGTYHVAPGTAVILSQASASSRAAETRTGRSSR